MKYGALFIFVVFLSLTAHPQRYREIGIFGGASYYKGDLNPKRHFPGAHTHFAYGAIWRENLNKRWAVKASLMRGRISAIDANFPANSFQIDRNLSFFSTIHEFSGTIEFNFFEFNPFAPASFFQSADKITPYAFIGLGIFRFNPQAKLGNNVYDLYDHNTELEEYSRTSLAIPYGAGFKFRISQRILMSMEFGLRLTFTDYIDDVSGRYPNSPDLLTETGIDLSNRSLRKSGPDGTNWGTQRGNSQSNDWYHFAGFTISVNITRNPNDCHFDQDKYF